MRKIESDPRLWATLLIYKDHLSLRELGDHVDKTPGAIIAAFRRNEVDRVSAPAGPRSTRRPIAARKAEARLKALDTPNAALAKAMRHPDVLDAVYDILDVLRPVVVRPQLKPVSAGEPAAEELHAWRVVKPAGNIAVIVGPALAAALEHADLPLEINAEYIGPVVGAVQFRASAVA